METKIAEQTRHFEDVFKDFNIKLTTDLPDTLAESKKELESWKRYFVRIQRDCEEMRNKQQTDQR